MNQEGRREQLQTLVSLIREKKFPYEERAPTPIDWARYDAAQVHEANSVLNLIRDVVDLADQRVQERIAPVRRRGPKPAPVADKTKILLAQTYLGGANRVAQGYELLFAEKLRLSSHFSYKTIERAYHHEGVNLLLDEVFLLTKEPVRGLERVFSIDGSGTPTTVKVRYAHDRATQRRSTTTADAWAGTPHDYVYAVAILGVKYKLLAAWKSRADHTVGEHGVFPEALAQLRQSHPTFDSLLGDGIFATRPCCKLVAEAGGTPRFMPKRNATFKSHGVPAWPRMLADLLDHPQEWLRQYHPRSNSETAWSVMDKLCPRPLRKRIDERKETEDYARAVLYNIKRLGYLTHLADIHPLPDPPGRT